MNVSSQGLSVVLAKPNHLRFFTDKELKFFVLDAVEIDHHDHAESPAREETAHTPRKLESCRLHRRKLYSIIYKT